MEEIPQLTTRSVSPKKEKLPTNGANIRYTVSVRNSISDPVEVGFYDADTQSYVLSKGGYVSVKHGSIRNSHAFAAAARHITDRVVLELAFDGKEFTGPADGVDVAYLLPNTTQLSRARTLLCRWGSGSNRNQKGSARVVGVRDWVSRVEAARGLTVYTVDPRANTAKVIVARDAYTLGPTELVRELVDHRNIESGVLCYLILRDLPGEEGSFYADRYRGKVQQPIQSDEESHSSPDESDEEDEVQMTPLTEYDALELNGWTQDGHFTGVASVKSDSHYHHALRSNAFFESSQIPVEIAGRHYSVARWIDRSVGPYVIMRVMVKLERAAVTHIPVLSRHRPGTFVVGGIIPSFVHALSAMALRVDPHDKRSLQLYVGESWVMLAKEWGAHWRALYAHHDRLRQCATETAMRCFNDLQIAYVLPGLNQVERSVDANLAANIAGRTGAPMGLADTVVSLIKPQTRLSLLFNAVAACKDFALWVWRKCSDWFGSAADILGVAVNFASATTRFGSSMEGRYNRFVASMRYSIGRTTLATWLARYPRLERAVEIAFEVFGVFVLSAAEELLKRAVPFPFALAFGAVEGLMLVATHWDSELTDAKLVALKTIAKHAAFHLLMRLVPLAISVPIHTVHNLYVRGLLKLGQTVIVAAEEEMADIAHFVPPSQRAPPPNTRVEINFDGEWRQLSAETIANLPERPPVAIHRIMVPCDSSAGLSTTTASLSNVLMMVHERLHTSPKFPESMEPWPLLPWLWPHLTPVSVREIKTYIEARPWPAAKRELYLCHLDEITTRSPGGVSNTNLKSAEKLPNKVEGSSEAKARPFHPMGTECVEDFALLIPLKEAMIDPITLMWNEEDRQWEPSGYQNSAVVLRFITDANYSNLGAYYKAATVSSGLTIFILGDDLYAIRNCEGVLRAFAGDIKQCDASCREQFQNGFWRQMQYCFDDSPVVGECSARDLREMRKPRRLQIPGMPPDVGLRYVPDEMSTLTGVVLTAVKATFAQTGYLIDTLNSIGEQLDAFPARLVQVASAWGFEVIPEGRADWSSPQSQSFLGGHFSAHGVFVPENTSKVCLTFPNCEEIYGLGAASIFAHMKVLSLVPEARVNPVSAAFVRLYERSCAQHDLPGAARLLAKAGGYIEDSFRNGLDGLPVCSIDDYQDIVDSVCRVKNVDLALFPRVRTLVEHIDGLDRWDGERIPDAGLNHFMRFQELPKFACPARCAPILTEELNFLKHLSGLLKCACQGVELLLQKHNDAHSGATSPITIMSSKRKRTSPANQQMAFNNALMADIRALRGELSKRKQPPVSGKKGVRANQTLPTRQPRTQAQVGAAIRVRMPTVGMSDLMQHRVSWVAGVIYVGNGTKGATNSVYFQTTGGNDLTAGTGGGFWIPFAPADTAVGATYANTLLKLYRRIRIRKASVHLRTIQSSTTNNAVIAVAPCLGPPGAAEFATQTADTSAAQTLQNLMSVSGMQSCDSFENLSLELSKYIAGGTGPQQNEFATANTSAVASDPGQQLNVLGVVPTAFQVAGNSTVAALQGTITHNVVCEMVCDLLDFVGAVSVIDPSAFAESKEERRGRLLSELSALARDDKGKRDLSSSPSRSL